MGCHLYTRIGIPYDNILLKISTGKYTQTLYQLLVACLLQPHELIVCSIICHTDSINVCLIKY